MKQNLINEVIQEMILFLNNAQAEKLQMILQHTLFNYEIVESENKDNNLEQNLVELFLSAKRIEGCSKKSLKYYLATIQSMLDEVGKNIKHIFTIQVLLIIVNKKTVSFFWLHCLTKICANHTAGITVKQ